MLKPHFRPGLRGTPYYAFETMKMHFKSTKHVVSVFVKLFYIAIIKACTFRFILENCFQIEDQKSIYHEYNLVFFHTGHYKIGMACTSLDSLPSNYDGVNVDSPAIGQSWKLIPPIDIMLVE